MKKKTKNLLLNHKDTFSSSYEKGDMSLSPLINIPLPHILYQRILKETNQVTSSKLPWTTEHFQMAQLLKKADHH